MFNFPTTPNEAGKGKLITFIPLKNNVGASTLASYTALSYSSFRKVNLIDFNPDSKVRSYFGYTAETTSVSLLDIRSATTPDSIYAASEQYNENLNIFLGALPKVLDIHNIDTALILKASSYLKRSAELSVAVSGVLHGYSWALPLVSDLIFVVVKPDRPSLDNYREQIDFLARLGCQDRIKIVLNQEKMPGGIVDTSNFFTPDIIIPYDVEIIRECNKREFKPNKKFKNDFLKIINNHIEDKEVNLNV